MPYPHTLTIQPGETYPYDFDYDGVIAADDTISTIVGVDVVSKDPTDLDDLTIGTPVASDDQVAQVQITAAAASAAGKHKLRCRVNTANGGQNIQLDGYLQVVDY